MKGETPQVRDGYLLDIECTNESGEKVYPYLVKKNGRATADLFDVSLSGSSNEYRGVTLDRLVELFAEGAFDHRGTIRMKPIGGRSLGGGQAPLKGMMSDRFMQHVVSVRSRLLSGNKTPLDDGREKAPSWEPDWLDTLRSQIASGDTASAFDLLIDHARALKGFRCGAGKHGYIYDFRYIDSETGEWVFAFITNKQHLLFYLRKPGVQRFQHLRDALESEVAKIEETSDGQWKLRIEKAFEADALLGVLFHHASDDGEVADEKVEQTIQQRIDIGPREKAALIRARRGHGIFRKNLEQIERQCRVTGLTDRSHLRASHIKPWRDSDDHEKIDGYNGLLLSPHIDHLFDRGYLSFTDSGDLIVSQRLGSEVADAWGLTLPVNVGAFCPEQRVYLQYHRRRVFKDGEEE